MTEISWDKIPYTHHLPPPPPLVGKLEKQTSWNISNIFFSSVETWIQHDTPELIIAEGKTGRVFIENEILASYFSFQIQAELIITTVANWVRIRKRYKCLLLYINIKTLPVSAKYFNFKIFLKIFCYMYVEICPFL